MSDRNVDRESRAFKIACDALDRSSEAREAFVRAQCEGDDELITAVLSYLAHAIEADEVRDEHPMVGRVVGGCLVSRAVGVGGMGEVFEAQHIATGRLVALKVTRDAPEVMGPEQARTLRSRVAREVAALAAARHDGIAQVIDAGVTDHEFGRRPYIVMEFVNGPPITAYARARGLGVRERLRLMAQVAEAMQAAHVAGFTHRDLKPGNILVNDAGVPKVVDFGIALGGPAAKDGGDRTLLTRGEGLMGTLAYMAPEQFLPGAISDARTDVYALGVVLYELLCDKKPMPVESMSAAQAAVFVETRDPVRLGAMDRTLRGDIELIAHKAMEKKPVDRYESAAAMAKDLRAFLDGRPITAREPTLAYRAAKFVRRNQSLTAGAAVAVMALVSALIVSSVFLSRAERANERYEDNRWDLFEALATIPVRIEVGGDQKSDAALFDQNVLTTLLEFANNTYATKPEIRAAILHGVGDAAYNAGLLERAESAFELEIEIRKGQGVEFAVDLAAAQSSLCRVLKDTGRAEQALAMARESTRTIRTATDPRWLPERAGMLENLGQVLLAMGRADEALGVLAEGLDILREQGESVEKELGYALYNKGTCLAALTRDGEAVPLFEEAVRVLDSFRGEDIPRKVATARIGLVRSLTAVGRLEDAKAELDRVMPIAEGVPSLAERAYRASSELFTALDKVRPGEGFDVRAREAATVAKEAAAPSDEATSK